MARSLTRLLGTLAIGVSIACSADSTNAPAPSAPTGPIQATPQPPAQPAGPITFSGLTHEGTAVTSYIESDFTTLATAGSWQAGANYGNPRPFIRFQAQAGATVTGALQITAGGSTFGFLSTDLYASTTPIPYVITGLRNAATVFSISGTLPNTFGAFRTVSNPNAAAVVDTLTITLTNAAAACCGNPMGVDNIALVK